MKYILIDKKNNQVRSMSENIIGYDNDLFELKVVPWEKADQDNLDKSISIYYKEDKFEFEPTDEQKKITIKEDIDNTTTLDELKNIIKNLI